MEPFLLLSACDPSSLFMTNSGWLGINMLVVLFSVTFGAAIYAFSNFMPGERAEKLRGITRYEIFEAFMSAIIIIALFGFTSVACNTGALLTGQQSYTNLFSFADSYLGSLLFTNGVSLVSQLYSASVNYVVASNIVLFIEQIGQTALSAFFSTLKFGQIVSVSPGESIEFVLLSYSSSVTGTYAGLTVVAFAPLYLLFLLLPIIQGGALTLVVPVALIMRSISFTGPKLREASNLFLALAIGFYFVLPLTIAFNAYVASCLNIQLIASLQVSCPNYPYQLQPYALPTSVTSLFTQASGQSITVPSGTIPFISTDFNLLQAYGFNSASSIGNGAYQVFFNYVLNAPNVAAGYGEQVAVYLFLGLFMLGLDMAITAGFINGLGKGLNALSRIFGTESFWE